MSDYFNMGGYALYVWPTYLLAGAFLIGLLIATLRASRQAERTLDGLKQARRAGRAGEPEDGSAVIPGTGGDNDREDTP